MDRPAVLVFVGALLVTLGVETVSGSGGAPQPPPPRPQATSQESPAEEAVDHYNRGLRLRDKAWKFQEKADGVADPNRKEKYLEKAQKQYKKAIEEFRIATQKNAAFHQAYGGLGYALRKTGDYSSALSAYDKALALEPDYTPAIEYRAEAYLGLGRIEDAKQAYVGLTTLDPERAAELLAAMRQWIDRRQGDAGGLTAGTLEEFAAWVSEREEETGHKSSAQGKGNGW